VFRAGWGEANIPGEPRKRKAKLALRVQYGALPYRFTPEAALENPPRHHEAIEAMDHSKGLADKRIAAG
jgi:hypothetical protein